MDDQILLKLALTCSIVGIIALFFAAQTIKAEEMAIADAMQEKDGRQINVNGKVVEIKTINSTNGNFAIVSIEEMQKISIFLQSEKSEGDYSSLIGKKVSVEGKIQDYNGKKEIIGERIEISSQE